MTEFSLDITIDPSSAKSGISDVSKRLSDAEIQARRLRGSLTDALALREARSASASLRAIEHQLARTKTQAMATSSAFKGIFTGVSTIFVTREILQSIDAYQSLQNRLRQVTNGQEDLAATTQRLLDISNRSRASLEGTITVYSRIVQNVERFRNDTSEAARFVELLNKGLATAGLSGSETTAVMVQLSQALQSGRLQGDELRTILEGFPQVARLVANALKVPITEVKRLSSEGKITTDVLVDAFFAGAKGIEDSFGKAVPTLSQQFQKLKNEVLVTIGEIDKGVGSSRIFGNALEKMTDVAKDARGALDVLGESLGTGLQENAAESALNLDLQGRQIVKLRKEIEDLQRVTLPNGQIVKVSLSPSGLKDLEDLRAKLADIEAQAKKTTKATVSQKTGEKLPPAVDPKIEKARLDTLRSIGLELDEELEKLEALNSGQRDKLGLLEIEQKLRKADEKARKSAPQTKEELIALQALVQEERKLNVLRNDVLGPMRDELEILRLQTEGQHAKAEAEQIYQQLKRDGLNVSDAEKQSIEAQVVALQKARDIASFRQDVFGPKEQFERDIESARRLSEENEGNAEALDLIKRKADEVRLAYLESSTQIGDGFERAFLRMKLEAQDFASVADQAVNVFADHATDALTTFLTTGELSFKEFANSLVADLTRILARMLIVQALSAAFGPAAPAVSGLGGFALGGNPFGGGRQHGGPVSPNQAVMVGEGGPELFVPRSAGTVMSAPQTAAALAPPEVNVQVVNVTDPSEIPKAMDSPAGHKVIMNAIAKNRNDGRRLLS